MGIADLPYHRVRIGIAILFAAAVAVWWAATWARCQPRADAGPYVAVMVCASIVGCVCWAAVSLPAMFSADRRPVLTLAIGIALAALIAVTAANMVFGPDILCSGDKWGG